MYWLLAFYWITAGFYLFGEPADTHPALDFLLSFTLGGFLLPVRLLRRLTR